MLIWADNYFCMDPLVDIQNTIRQVLPIVLIGPGLLLAGCGLFIWLGGLRWTRSIAAFSAAMAGLVCVWYFTGHQLLGMVLIPVILAVLGIYFHKAVVVVLGGALAGVLVLLMPLFTDLGKPAEPARQYQPAQTPMDLFESIDWVQGRIEAGTQAIKNAIDSISAGQKNMALAAVVIVCVAGLISWRLVCAATCSLIGTTLIFCGMGVLLLYKGSEAFQQMVDQRAILGLAAIGMFIGGVLIQLALCPAKQKKISKDDFKKELLKEDGKK